MSPVSDILREKRLARARDRCAGDVFEAIGRMVQHGVGALVVIEPRPPWCMAVVGAVCLII
jgi:hypothetical protein